MNKMKFFCFSMFIVIGTRGTPRVQFANIRKMVLSQGLPHCLRLCVNTCMARHAQTLNVSTQVYMLDRKIWKLFRPRGNGRKRTKCDQFFCPALASLRSLRGFVIGIIWGQRKRSERWQLTNTIQWGRYLKFFIFLDHQLKWEDQRAFQKG